MVVNFEVSRVLGRTRSRRRADDPASEKIADRPMSNLFPEPIDLLWIGNDRDTFTFPTAAKPLTRAEPLLVLERVHGLPLDRWRETYKPSLAMILGVLADLLDFMTTLHAEGLLLGGLSPETVWADESGWLHYLGSDLVLAAEGKKQAAQRELLAATRSLNGYAAPEVFQKGPIGPPSDLFSWGALAYYLITGQPPAEITAKQGVASPRFEQSHFDQLAASLGDLPVASLRRLQHAFRVPGGRFVSAWPDGFLTVVRACLMPGANARPDSPTAVAALWASATDGAARSGRTHRQAGRGIDPRSRPRTEPRDHREARLR